MDNERNAFNDPASGRVCRKVQKFCQTFEFVDLIHKQSRADSGTTYGSNSIICGKELEASHMSSY